MIVGLLLIALAALAWMLLLHPDWITNHWYHWLRWPF